VWNYEVGAKNRLFGGRVSLDTSAYLVTWRDIQTSVSVNSCNQSLVDNLGGAVAKGFDLNAQFRPIDSLNLGVTAGYNETSFTGNTVLGTSKVYSAASAIPNSGPPVRASFFARYDFDMANLPFYVLGDVSYQSKTRRSGTMDRTAYNFDANLVPDEAYTQTNIRVGFQYEQVDLSVFINNLTDEAPYLGYGHTNSTNPVYTGYTIQPRTVGMTLAYRN
jgi:outer membrane receptor protein involved in Fe transport